MESRSARLLAYLPVLLVVGLLFTVSFVKTINAGDNRSSVQKNDPMFSSVVSPEYGQYIHGQTPVPIYGQ